LEETGLIRVILEPNCVFLQGVAFGATKQGSGASGMAAALWKVLWWLNILPT